MRHVYAATAELYRRNWITWPCLQRRPFWPGTHHTASMWLARISTRAAWQTNRIKFRMGKMVIVHRAKSKVHEHRTAGPNTKAPLQYRSRPMNQIQAIRRARRLECVKFSNLLTPHSIGLAASLKMLSDRPAASRLLINYLKHR